ncbi:FecR family protein [Mucilaginibacter paludis]|uniref:Anti-FecI sigma factor, FecR n=1 Tax=Mucilaginibacter paludis DSM 18603 TaxID=714943 RepID=H1Y885_9SPHI|nr:FecR family protein [Mucilaginibacter paludis]EHQ24904.1 anti-FecI sigma factor, FecR [Mucilaginibacter paludis DSM 18603]
MQDERQYLEELFRKYQNGSVTDAEKDIIERWLSHLDVNEVPLSAEAFFQQEQRSKKALKESLLIQPETKVIRLPRWAKVAAAAAMLIITASLYFYPRLKHSPEVAARYVKPDFPPGTNRAILTLANGSKINLTGVKNGVLARQGITAIQKTNNSEIIYTATDSKGSVNDTAPLLNTISTPIGGQYQVTLPDGTKVWLNAVSYIRFPASFDGDRRRVEIGGEVYFEVAKNPHKPFIVICAGQQITVLGTHFNVNAYPEENGIKTTLLEGSVKVSALNQNIFLKPGEQSLVAYPSSSQPTALLIPDADINEAVAWQKGMFYFKRTGIATIMRQAARWYDMDVHFEGPVPDKYITGKIRRNVNASEMLKMLEYTGVKFNIQGKKVIVLSTKH